MRRRLAVSGACLLAATLVDGGPAGDMATNPAAVSAAAVANADNVVLLAGSRPPQPVQGALPFLPAAAEVSVAPTWSRTRAPGPHFAAHGGPRFGGVPHAGAARRRYAA